MSELVDRLVNQAPAGGEATTPPIQGDAQGLPPGDFTEAELAADPRLKQLVSQKSRYHSQNRALKDQLGSLTNDVAELRGMLQANQQHQQQPTGIPSTTMRDFSEDQLHEAIRTGHETQNMELVGMAQRELGVRDARKVAEEQREVAERNFSQTAHKERVMMGISSKFGDEQGILNKDSDLYQHADSEYASLIQLHGRDRVESTPELMELAFHRSKEATVWPQIQNRLAAAEQKNQRLEMQLAQMERSSAGPVIGPTDERKAALEKGDLKSAIRNMAIVKSFDQPPQ
jgi:hypothetical protein